MENKEKNLFSWDSITINKYYELVDIVQDETEDDITKNVKVVSVILDKDEKEIWDMELSKVGEYINKLKFLTKFDIPRAPGMKIKLPSYNLEVLKDLSKITIAQYVDYQNFVRLPLRDGIDKILSVFLVPEGCKYNEGYDVLDLQAELRDNLSFRVAEGLLSFFLKSYLELMIRSLKRCARSIRKTKSQEMKKEWKEKEKEIKKQMESLICLVGSR